MKRSIAVLIIALTFSVFTACGSGAAAPTTPAPIPTPTPPPIVLPVEPPPVPGAAPVTYDLLLYNSAGVGFSNGVTYSHFMNGIVAPVGPSMFAVDDIIYEVNAFGATVATTQLPAIPSAVAISGPDIWTFETVPPEYAALNGGLSREYTRVWLNYIEQGSWLDRQWTATKAVSTLSGDVIAYDTLNRLYTITGPEVPHYASEDGIFVHTVDVVNRTGKVMTGAGNFNISWATNYFNGADEWLELGGSWYSWNGYRWNVADGLTEQDTALADFINWTRPVVIAAGVRMDAALERGYWIEANTGWLWEYTPAMDRLETVLRLYVADGERVTGIAHASDMEPQIISTLGRDVLYYTFEGQIWRYDFGSGINGPFIAGKKVRRM